MGGDDNSDGDDDDDEPHWMETISISSDEKDEDWMYWYQVTIGGKDCTA
jgi:hypothetical protein